MWCGPDLWAAASAVQCLFVSMLGEGLAWEIELGCSSCHMCEPGWWSQCQPFPGLWWLWYRGQGGAFYSVLLAWPEPLPGLSAWGPRLPLRLTALSATGPFLLGLICPCPSSVCGVLFSPGDYVNTIDWFVLNSSGCQVIITRC